jgi:alkenylglycerophosphocholine/alkenylglycerophosphoethanolamine hydrolase
VPVVAMKSKEAGMWYWLLAAFVFAVLEALAVWRGWPRAEYVAKPSVMIALFAWLWTSAGLNGALFWFGLGILFSLAGDVFLIWLDRLFIYGLAAFLLGHVAYIIGFNSPASAFSWWETILVFVIGIGGLRIIRPIVAALTKKGQARLRVPVIVYSVVISLMLISAMMKLTDMTWKASAAALASLGAFLFYLSDVILAWNKFVSLIKHGRLLNIAAYHLGQIALIAGVVIQYS